MTASFLLRFQAFAWDYLLILACLTFLVVVNVMLFLALQQLFEHSPAAVSAQVIRK